MKSVSAVQAAQMLPLPSRQISQVGTTITVVLSEVDISIRKSVSPAPLSAAEKIRLAPSKSEYSATKRSMMIVVSRTAANWAGSAFAPKGRTKTRGIST